MTANRRIRLARLPQGEPQAADFALEEIPAGRPGKGEVLLRSIYLSMDPYQRNWMAGAKSYGVMAEPGAVVIGRAVSEVLESSDPRCKPGDFVYGETGWQTHPVAKADILQPIDPSFGPISTAIGVLGSPGLTAWVGVLDIGQLKAGETVVVSAAAGAVGSVAGQIARLQGARVVGIAGVAEKCRIAVEEFGYAQCVSHRSPTFAEDLGKACPQGVDFYFDNTGGSVTDTVYARLRSGARVALCGLVAEYGDPDARGPNMRCVLSNQALVKGFSVRHNLHRMGEYRAQASAWIREGKLRYREEIVQGIENTPDAFRAILKGSNQGKMLVQVGADPTRR